MAGRLQIHCSVRILFLYKKIMFSIKLLLSVEQNITFARASLVCLT